VSVEKKLAMGAAAVIVLMALVTLRTPTYEASTTLWVDEDEALAGTREGSQVIVLEMSAAATSRPVAEKTIERLQLNMSEAELLSNLKSEQIDNTNFIRLSYTATDPAQAKQIVREAGDVASDLSPLIEEAE